MALKESAPGAGTPPDGPLDKNVRLGLVTSTALIVGSIRPKVTAACGFDWAGGISTIGALADLPQLISADAGTTISSQYSGLTHSTPARI